ncbi:MAG: hypothetical protein RMJ53_05150 [Chitinophagales bacterium]|nr:hypothetical protein [Chitinophagales bacterium]
MYLIKTPEYEIENLEEVEELLNSFQGPMEFIAENYEFNPEQFPFLEQISEETPLSWSELFFLCDFYRKTFQIGKSDFIILLTKRINSFNFFSIFNENKNAFVQTSGWELFTQANSKFPIAYEVVANVLRCLMKLHLSFPNDWIHIQPLGCMNDFCGNKKEIILKLRTGDICNDCLAKMKKENIDDEIINQSLGIFEVIRDQLLFKQGFTRNINPKSIHVNKDGKIFIGNKMINLNPLESTLFIFFLKHNEGIMLNDLQSHKKELLAIYRKLRPAGEESSIDELIKPYYQGGTFSVNKNRLNKKLKKKLGEPLANFYYLNGNRGEAFKINISPDYISFDIRY